MTRKTYDYYQSLLRGISETIRNSIVTSEDGEHMFKLNNGHCPLLLDSGLCKVHAELGEEHLGVVCSQFQDTASILGSIKNQVLVWPAKRQQELFYQLMRNSA